MKSKSTWILALMAFCLSSQVQAQKTTADYDRAAAVLNFKAWKYMDNYIQPAWTTDNRVWYKSTVRDESQYFLFSPAKKKMITAASKDELGLPPETEDNTPDWSGKGVFSPDKTKVVFIKDYNLWVKDFISDREIQITTDGYKNYGYATDNAGWRHSDQPVVSWSPNSKKIATFRLDERYSNDMYLVRTQVGAPELESWKYPLPGDSVVFKLERLIIDLNNPAQPQIIPLHMTADDHRGTLSDDVSSSGTFDDNSWSADASELAFVSTSRDHKSETLRIANTTTGEVKTVFEELVPTQYESGQGTINWQYLADTKEIIWYSERSDWGQLYLYDAVSGKEKNAITAGNYVVTRVLKTDPKARVIYFEAKGREPGNPYHAYVYRADFSGKNLVLLTPSPGNHSVTFSPDGKYILDTYSQTDVPPVSELRTTDKGKLISLLAKTDISRMTDNPDWIPATPFSVKSADKRWDLYGVYYTPKKMISGVKYPVLVSIYPGPQGGSVHNWGFSTGFNEAAAVAQLGFIVVELEGSCNPNRSKSFHDACYGNMGENTLPDQISGLQQLQERLGFLDLDKVGIYGHSGGGFATAAALLKYPEFFKVGVAQSGNHDNRNYEDDWGERYIGLLSGDNYKQQANQTYAGNLKGKLLIAHGGMDDNVPPYNTYLLVDALIKANKDFDLLIFPNARHGYGRDYFYMMRRRWDYFVKNLQGMDPPKEYKIEMK